MVSAATRRTREIDEESVGDYGPRRITRRQTSAWLTRLFIAAASPALLAGCAGSRRRGGDRPARDDTYPTGGRDARVVPPDTIRRT